MKRRVDARLPLILRSPKRFAHLPRQPAIQPHHSPDFSTHLYLRQQHGLSKPDVYLMAFFVQTMREFHPPKVRLIYNLRV